MPHSSEDCVICLQSGADTPPPCGGTDRLLFHARCLRRAREHAACAPFRCPHCNVECEPPRDVDALLETWPSPDDPSAGFWFEGPVFVPIVEGRLLTCSEVARGLAARLLLLGIHVAICLSL